MNTTTNSIVNNLMNENILGFETAATVMDQKPVIEQSFLPDGTALKPQLEQDEFSKQNDSLTVVKNPLWKKLLFAGLVAGGVILGCVKLKSKIFPALKSGFKKLTGMFRKKSAAKP